MEGTSGQKLTLEMETVRRDGRKYVLKDRIIDSWSSVRKKIVWATNTNIFKTRLGQSLSFRGGIIWAFAHFP